MNLHQRALVVIFPVILVGYGLVGAATYDLYRQARTSLAKAQLSQQLSELADTFASYRSLEAGLSYVVRNSADLRVYLNEKDEAYRMDALGLGLQDSIRSLSNQDGTFISCTIFGPDNRLDYYYDNGPDPFTRPADSQMQFAHEARRAGAAAPSDYVVDKDGSSLLLSASFVMPGIAQQPIVDQKSQAFLLQIAVRPQRFEILQHRLEAQYHTRLEWSARPLASNAMLSQVIQLEPGLFARLTPAPFYLGKALRRQAYVVVAGGVIMSLLSGALLMLLIRRYITDPISRLDAQVTETMAGRRQAIDLAFQKGEVGSLALNMQTLHRNGVKALQDIQQLYWTDALTGIGNRAFFNATAQRLLLETGSSGQSLTLLFMGLDNFKTVNDRHGHEAGDALLVGVAMAIRSVIHDTYPREDDAFCARLSGDEFALLIRSDPADGVTDLIAERVVPALLACFKDGFRVDSHSYPVTASIGIALSPQDADTVGGLVACADAAKYEAKSRGRNRSASFFPGLLDAIRRRTIILEALERADYDREFSLVYMPMIDRAARVVSCEALLRWTAPALGVVSPAEFIPLAEAATLFSPIDHWVIDHALADFQTLVGLFGEDVLLNVNMSSGQILRPTIASEIAAIAKRHGVRPDRVELELTETFAVGVNADAKRTVDALRAHGFRVAIDDFGAGFTSLQQVIDYPADTIKIDRMIIGEMTIGEGETGLRSIVAFCHAFMMEVVGEGVDTPDKAARLRDAECDRFQGFSISPPERLDALTRWAAYWKAHHTEILPSFRASDSAGAGTGVAIAAHGRLGPAAQPPTVDAHIF